MDVTLNLHEARVLGVLIEKGYTTPEQYPLSLNAATNGANQKSNRDPVSDFSEAEVTVALTGLKFKHLVGATTPAGSRVEKYRHNALERLGVDDPSLAVLAELLLRGPQTQGELRQRASRMRTIASLDELQQVLAGLTEHGLVRRLPPRPGSRAERYGELLSEASPEGAEEAAPASSPAPSSPAPSPAASGSPASGSPAPGDPAPGDRVDLLEARVATLERQLSRLAEQLGETLE